MQPALEDTDWLRMETVRDGPPLALIYGVFFLGLCLMAALLAAGVCR
jgi:hypothetical protein